MLGKCVFGEPCGSRCSISPGRCLDCARDWDHGLARLLASDYDRRLLPGHVPRVGMIGVGGFAPGTEPSLPGRGRGVFHPGRHDLRPTRYRPSKRTERLRFKPTIRNRDRTHPIHDCRAKGFRIVNCVSFQRLRQTAGCVREHPGSLLRGWRLSDEGRIRRWQCSAKPCSAFRNQCLVRRLLICWQKTAIDQLDRAVVHGHLGFQNANGCSFRQLAIGRKSKPVSAI